MLKCVSEATAALYSVQVLPKDHIPAGDWHSQPACACACAMSSLGSEPAGEQLSEAPAESKLRLLVLTASGRFHLARSQIMEGDLLHSLQFLTCPHLLLKIISVFLHP